MTTKQVIEYIYNVRGHGVAQWNYQLLNPALLQIHANAIATKGGALCNCFGFVDGTVRPICRPNKNQRAAYNGHKRIHSLKFHSVTLPNGLVANMYRPVGIDQ